MAKQLRGQGAQIVVVLAHMGATTDSTSGVVSGALVDFAKKVSGIDAIFGGHTHSIVSTKVNGIPVGVANNAGKGYLNLKITLNADGTVSAGDMKYNDLSHSIMLRPLSWIRRSKRSLTKQSKMLGQSLTKPLAQQRSI